MPVTDSVNLWLGANVMLEYPVEEARDLLVSEDKQALAHADTLCQGQLSVSMAKQSLCAVHIQTALSCLQFICCYVNNVPD